MATSRANKNEGKKAELLPLRKPRQRAILPQRVAPGSARATTRSMAHSGAMHKSVDKVLKSDKLGDARSTSFAHDEPVAVKGLQVWVQRHKCLELGTSQPQKSVPSFSRTSVGLKARDRKSSLRKIQPAQELLRKHRQAVTKGVLSAESRTPQERAKPSEQPGVQTQTAKTSATTYVSRTQPSSSSTATTASVTLRSHHDSVEHEAQRARRTSQREKAPATPQQAIKHPPANHHAEHQMLQAASRGKLRRTGLGKEQAAGREMLPAADLRVVVPALSHAQLTTTSGVEHGEAESAAESLSSEKRGAAAGAGAGAVAGAVAGKASSRKWERLQRRANRSLD